MSASYELRRLRSLPDFHAARSVPNGFIVVTDRSDGTKIHRATCESIKADFFVQKVLTHRCKRGSYYLAPSFAAAAFHRPGKACATCRPDAEVAPPPRAAARVPAR